MGAFDVLVIPQKCENCGALVNMRYQFKYGSPWQKEYLIGNVVEWEGNPIRWNGEPMSGLIAADAEIEPCPECGFEYELSVVYIDNGRFIGAGRNEGRFIFSSNDYAIPIGKYKSSPSEKS